MPSETLQRAKEAPRKAWSWIKDRRQPGFRPRPGRVEGVLKATRTTTLAAALLWFMVAMTVDDLGTFRLPAYIFAIVGSLFIFSFGSILTARRIAFRHRDLDDSDFQARTGEIQRIGTLRLIATVLVFVAWLIMFTAGVPPWVG